MKFSGPARVQSERLGGPGLDLREIGVGGLSRRAGPERGEKGDEWDLEDDDLGPMISNRTTTLLS